ncbi:heme-binding protein [Anaerocolumna sp. AGMB13025]|uniref:GlcG/HbpS family heme-binding protein n=1 Tax=Anaerocolumna sp. AGMB13025 TaxID=3039116 RepID=UPI00241C2B80|nr:heme-binding protein [Anaerocolumna sp. AGMB13025]WFR55173.1 heme-binding protein [Anaerocolumna sp. AGMB13025]
MSDHNENNNNLLELYQDLDRLAGFIDGILDKSKSTELTDNLRLMKHKLLKTRTQMIEEAVKKALMEYLPPVKEEVRSDISLNQAVALIQAVEKEAVRRGIKAVIAIYNSAARPAAIHCMDDAYIASFDVAENKAYTSAALKMSTAVLKDLSQPGQELYGIQHTNQGRIVIFGGGEPLIWQGKIIGALGVSGGTEEQDRELAAFGSTKLEEVMTWQ